MSVRQKILAASLGFVLIVALLGLLARQQVDQMGRLVMGIYDHSFVGITYVNEAQAQFLRLVAQEDSGAPLAAPMRAAALRAVLDQLDVATERAGSAHTRNTARQVRAMVAALPGVAAPDLPAREAEADQAIARLVKNYSSEGLKARDRASELVLNSGRNLLGEIGLALVFALGLAFILGSNLSSPLMDLVGSIRLLTAGDLQHAVSPRLARRKDEIGAVARATVFFRETMQQNIAAGEDRVRLETENEAARLYAERSEAAIAAKSDFLATMSHEIRTPMNGVATIADLLADSELGADQLKMVNTIRQSAKWLIRVINDILDFSKLEAQQLHIEAVPFMLDEVIESSCQVLAAKAQEKGLALTIEGRDLPGLCRIGDPLRLRQIVLNLLGNAVKFTGRGSVTVELRAESDAVTLSVVDTGIGIPEDQIDCLFQSYNQLRSDTARSYGGTGLGLSITKNLVGLMGGTLEVTSVLGHGSRFTVGLPLHSDASSLCRPSHRAVESDLRWRQPDRAVSAANAAIVLCAEDNAINRDVLGRVLERLGFNYDMAEDGAAALALLDRARHGVLLTDAQMPGLDGWELAHAIRRDEAQHGLHRLPIVMLTANALSETDRRIEAVGIDGVLTKPLNMGVLEATLLGAADALGTHRVACPHKGTDQPARLQEVPAPQAVIDLDVLSELVGNDPGFLSEMLEVFRASVTAQHALLQSALAPDDLDGLARHAHAIKGAARYAGATSMAAICDVIEHRAKAGAAMDTLTDELSALNTLIDRLPGDIAMAMCGLKTKESVAL